MDISAVLSEFKGLSYRAWVLMIGLFVSVIVSYLGHQGLALWSSVLGLLLITDWRHFKSFSWVLGVMALSLLWILCRTNPYDFTHPKGDDHTGWLKILCESLFYVPVFLAATQLSSAQAFKLISLVKWACLGLGLVLAYETASNAALFRAICWQFHSDIRPDLAMVKVSVSSYYLMLLYWPLMLVAQLMSQKRILLFLSAILIIVPIIMSANAVTLALVISALTFWVAKLWPKTWIGIEKIIAAKIGLIVLLWPLLIAWLHKGGIMDKYATHLPDSWAERVHIWDTTSVKMFDKFIMGQGFDFSRVWSDIPLHPHNMSFQAVLELGFVGLILLAGFWVCVILRTGQATTIFHFVRHSDESQLMNIDIKIDTKPYFLATAVCYFTFAFISFGMWQEWFLAMAALSTCVCLVASKALDEAILSQYQL